jgi:hypothetical protein
MEFANTLVNNEIEFQNALVEVLKAQKETIRKVELNHGSHEDGIDILYEAPDVFGKIRLFGIQAKISDIKCSDSSSSDDVKRLIGQIAISFGSRYLEDRKLDAVYIVTLGEITPNARKYIEFARIGYREIYLLDNQDLDKFSIEKGSKTTWLQEL